MGVVTSSPPSEVNTSTQRRHARIAGLWYLAMAVSGPIGLMYVPSKIVVDGDAAATAANLAAHPLLVRVGVLSSLACQVSFVFLALALKRLFRGVNDAQARLMLALVIASVPIAVANNVFPLAAVEIAGGADTLRSLTLEQRSALAMVLMKAQQFGIAIVEIFWGLWLFPFAALVMRSGFIPKIFGVLLMVSGSAYVVECVIVVLAPQHRVLVGDILTLPLASGEMAMLLWLLIKGVRSRTGAFVPSPAITGRAEQA